MRTLHPIPSLLLGLGLATAFLQADTLVVLPGTSIQAKIDEAVDGDIIAIFGGTYTEPNITVNKAVRLVELQGQEVFLQGNVLVTSDVTDAPPIEGFTFNNGNVLVIQSKGSIVVKNCDFTQGGTLKIEPLPIPSANVRIEGGSYHEVNIYDHGHLGEQDLPYLRASIVGITATDLNIINRGWSSPGSVIKVQDVEVGNITHRSGILDVTESRVDSNISSNGAVMITVTDCEFNSFSSVSTKVASIFRSLSSGTVSIDHAEKAWVGYSQIYGAPSADNSGRIHVVGGGASPTEFTCVGNDIRRQGTNSTTSAMRLSGSLIATINNNKIWNQGDRGDGDDTYYDRVINIERLSAGNRIRILNNLLHHNFSNSSGAYTIRIFGDLTGVDIKLLNNVIYNKTGSMIDSSLGPVVEGNVMFGGGDLHAQGGVGVDISKNTHYGDPRTTDPGFVGWTGSIDFEAPETADVFNLAPDSILRDAGSNNPLYNDRDGTRNDAGPSGGVWYDPEGWTTDKPVVIAFDLTPEVLLEGVDTEVTVDEVKAVSAP